MIQSLIVMSRQDGSHHVRTAPRTPQRQNAVSPFTDNQTREGILCSATFPVHSHDVMICTKHSFGESPGKHIMYPTLFLFGQEIPSYTLMVILGYLSGFAVAWKRKARYGLMPTELVGIYALGGAGAFLGGKAFFIIQGIPQFLEEHAQTGISFGTYATEAGFVFYGGLIGALLCIALAAKLCHLQVWDTMNCLLPSLPLGQAFGRVGCFLVGCCYGMPCSFGFLMDPGATSSPQGIRLFPIQLVESATCLAIFILLLQVDKRQNRPPTCLLGIYLLCYGAARFVIEFFRYDSVRGFIGPLSVSQWFSLGAVTVGTLLLVLPATSRARRKHHESGS